MKISIAQIGPSNGDISANKAKISEFIEKARSNGSELVIFPELSIPGYPAEWILSKESLVEQNLQVLQELAASTEGIGLIVGYLDKNPVEEGKRYYSATALICNKDIQFVSYKTNLTDYDYFLQSKWFEPAISLVQAKFKEKKILIGTLEDFFFSSVVKSPFNVGDDKFSEVKRKKIDVAVVVSAKPYIYQSELKVMSILAAIGQTFKCSVIFVNYGGAIDNLVFEGNSIVIDQSGKVVASGNSFVEDLVNVDIDYLAGDLHGENLSDLQILERALQTGIKSYIEKTKPASVYLVADGSLASYVNITLVSSVAPKGNVNCFVTKKDAEITSFLNNLGLKQIPIAADKVSGDIANLTGSAGTVSENMITNLICRIPALVQNNLVISNVSKSTLLDITIPGHSAYVFAPLKELSHNVIASLVQEVINKGNVNIPLDKIDSSSVSGKEDAYEQILSGKKVSDVDQSVSSAISSAKPTLLGSDCRVSGLRLCSDIFKSTSTIPKFWSI
ncbi:MAG: hypothetical protein HY606_06140 [Planctomycetes bacterium]|nr:hypothetical protein [Planctomycetota bacterium]